MAKARESAPEPGSGRVLNLVSAFEKLLTIPKNSESKDEKELNEDVKKVVKWGLTRLQMLENSETAKMPSFCPEDFVLTAESLGLDSQVSSWIDGSQRGLRGSSGRRSSTGSLRSQRSKSVMLRLLLKKDLLLEKLQVGGHSTL